MIAAALDAAVKAVAPITGVSIGKLGDRSTWAVRFTPEATKEQRDAAAAVLAAFDPAAEAAKPAPPSLAERIATLESKVAAIERAASK